MRYNINFHKKCFHQKCYVCGRSEQLSPTAVHGRGPCIQLRLLWMCLHYRNWSVNKQIHKTVNGRRQGYNNYGQVVQLMLGSISVQGTHPSPFRSTLRQTSKLTKWIRNPHFKNGQREKCVATHYSTHNMVKCNTFFHLCTSPSQMQHVLQRTTKSLKAAAKFHLDYRVVQLYISRRQDKKNK